MNKLYIFKSEMTASVHVCSDNELAEFTRKHNRITRRNDNIPYQPWSLTCSMEFQREQTAADFRHFLETGAGMEFIRKHISFNPLSELRKLMAVLPKSCRFYLMGGLSLDGHLGKLSRPHDDVDLICWRKDLAIFQKALKKIGYKTRVIYSKKKPKLAILMETDEENPAIEVKIIDVKPDNCFQLNSNAPTPLIYPKKFLGPVMVTLDGLKFPAITLPFMLALNESGKQNLKRIKKENPKLYKLLGYKITNNKNDRQIIRNLLGKSSIKR